MTVISRGKKDLNQDEIFNECRERGFVIVPLSQFRGHKCDAFMGYEGIWLPVEIKKTVKSKLTDNEATFGLACWHKNLKVIYATCFKDIQLAFTQEKNK